MSSDTRRRASPVPYPVLGFHKFLFPTPSSPIVETPSTGAAPNPRNVKSTWKPSRSHVPIFLSDPFSTSYEPNSSLMLSLNLHDHKPAYVPGETGIRIIGLCNVGTSPIFCPRYPPTFIFLFRLDHDGFVYLIHPTTAICPTNGCVRHVSLFGSCGLRPTPS